MAFWLIVLLYSFQPLYRCIHYLLYWILIIVTTIREVKYDGISSKLMICFILLRSRCDHSILELVDYFVHLTFYHVIESIPIWAIVGFALQKK